MYILSRQRARTQQKRSEIEYRKIWTITPKEHTVESNIFRRTKRKENWEVGRESQNIREEQEPQEEWMHAQEKLPNCMWFVRMHEYDGKNCNIEF